MSSTTEPNWQSYEAFRHRSIQPKLLDWLLEPGSLTARLKQHCQTFQVEVLKQQWSQAFLSERHSLNIPERRWANIREVKLICDGKPWVFARTVIPRATLTGKECSLLSMGTKPLGHLLFQHPQMMRAPFEIAEIKPQHYQFQFAKTGNEKSNTCLYARRSLFFLAGKPLSVSEVFTSYFPYP